MLRRAGINAGGFFAFIRPDAGSPVRSGPPERAWTVVCPLRVRVALSIAICRFRPSVKAACASASLAKQSVMPAGHAASAPEIRTNRSLAAPARIIRPPLGRLSAARSRMLSTTRPVAAANTVAGGSAEKSTARWSGRP